MRNVLRGKFCFYETEQKLPLYYKFSLYFKSVTLNVLQSEAPYTF